VAAFVLFLHLGAATHLPGIDLREVAKTDALGSRADVLAKLAANIKKAMKGIQ
jgi:hypothetical protein